MSRFLYMSVGKLGCFHTLWSCLEDGDVESETYLCNLSTDYHQAIDKARRVAAVMNLPLDEATDGGKLADIRRRSEAQKEADRLAENDARLTALFDEWLEALEKGEMPWGKFKGRTLHWIASNELGFAEFVVDAPESDVETTHWSLIEISKIVKERLLATILEMYGYRLPKPSAGYLDVLPGTRIGFNATITRVSEFEGQFGTTYYITLITPEGNCLLYRGGTFLGNEGEVLSGKATVKGFEEYNTIPQTIIQRVKLS